MQRTLVIIKPDHIQKHISCSDLIKNTDLKIIKLRWLVPSLDLAHKHYIKHKEKEIFDQITNDLTSGLLIVIVIEGVNAVNIIQNKIYSKKNSHSLILYENALHRSDSTENAEYEIALWFD